MRDKNRALHQRPSLNYTSRHCFQSLNDSESQWFRRPELRYHRRKIYLLLSFQVNTVFCMEVGWIQCMPERLRFHITTRFCHGLQIHCPLIIAEWDSEFWAYWSLSPGTSAFFIGSRLLKDLQLWWTCLKCYLQYHKTALRKVNSD